MLQPVSVFVSRSWWGLPWGPSSLTWGRRETLWTLFRSSVRKLLEKLSVSWSVLLLINFLFDQFRIEDLMTAIALFQKIIIFIISIFKRKPFPELLVRTIQYLLRLQRRGDFKTFSKKNVHNLLIV